MIEAANAVGRGWVAWVIPTSLDAGVLLAVVGLIWLAIRGRVAPQVGYGLFLLVPLKLLMPLGLAVPSPLAEWTPSAQISAWFEGPRDPGHPGGDGRSTIATGPVVATASLTFPKASVPTPVAAAHPISSARVLRAQGPSTVEGPSVGPAAMFPSAGRPRLSMPAMIVMAWFVVVLGLVGRLAYAQWRFGFRGREITPFDESRAGADVGGLSRLIGVSRTIRVVTVDGLASPSVWGLVRPTILLPRGFAESLTAEQLRWVLLHELAHVRRGDLWVVAVQRVAGILHFFNPAVWAANRVIHQLREYACDDIAVSLSGDTTGVGSSEAFLRTLQFAERREGFKGALGVFGLASKGACHDRVRRLLDSDRPTRSRSSVWSLAGLLLLAAVSLPRLQAADESDPPAAGKAVATPKSAALKTGPDEVAVEAETSFELRVVGPDGKPVPGADTELRTSPRPTAGQIVRGKYVGQGSYGAYMLTDAEGKIAIRFPRKPASFNVFIVTKGFGPYAARWSPESNGQPVPARFTAELEEGRSVGGIVVDPDGKPVAGVQVRPSIEFKKRPGDLGQLGSGASLKTDSAGKWRFDSVPASMGDVFVEINHSSFMSVRRPLTRAEFGLKPGEEPVGKVVLDRGATVTGRVTDDSGKPIAGALIRTKFLNDIRQAKTGEDGVYRLGGCEPMTARIVVSAKGRATDMKELRVDSSMGPVDFRLKPGGIVRIRVLDDRDKPVPRARILFQRWRGAFSYFEFGHVDQYADEKGYWEWKEAPLDEFQADICPPDGMALWAQRLVARDEEYVFRTPPTLVISGKVIDAQTREPIKKFRVVPGVRSGATHMNWARGEAFTATDGRYQIRHQHGYFAHIVRIEAEGYRAMASRDIKSDEGNVSIDFALSRGKDIVAKVVSPRSGPAAKAKVTLGVGGAQIDIHDGNVGVGGTYVSQVEADGSGVFRFPPQDGDFQLVIIHPSGFAHITSTPEWPVVRVIRLEPWSRAEGTFRVGRTPVANVPISLSIEGRHSDGPDVASLFPSYDATTGPDGRFVIEKIVPGRGRIGRRIMLTVDDGAADVTSSCMVSADFPAGKTLPIELGGSGRPVVGKLRPPRGFKAPVRWNFVLVSAQMEAKGDREKGPSLAATVDRDGSFRIDDVPPGKYVLDARSSRDGVGWLSNHRFEVQATGPGQESGPADLGTLDLKRP